LYSSKYRGAELNYETSPTLDILNSAKKNQEYLIGSGIFVGKARLAIQANPTEPNLCILCNKCMEGCRSNSIFSASHILNELLPSPLFHYYEGCLVEKFSEDDKGVSITFVETQIGIKKLATADFLVLGAGCFDSTKIINASTDVREEKYLIKDSQKFYFPVFTFKSNKKNIENSIELAHIYVQMIDYLGHIIQIQLYPGSKILIEMVQRLFGIRISRLFQKIFGLLINKFYIGMMYLHSDVSGNMELQFRDDNSAYLRGFANKDSKRVFNSAIWKMFLNARYLRFIPIPFFFLKAKIGHSQHFGSTLPMQQNHSKIGVGVNCVVNGFLRVFVVDSSVLPSIPGTPTTTLVMANSLRVSDEIINIIKVNTK
jgi:hypothetical protein